VLEETRPRVNRDLDRRGAVREIRGRQFETVHRDPGRQIRLHPCARRLWYFSRIRDARLTRLRSTNQPTTVTWRDSMSKSEFLRTVILLACLAGCSSHLRVSDIQLGRSLNADNSIANPTTSFGPRDTINMSVSTAGVGSGTISVRWLYGGRVVEEATKKVSYRDLAATDFSLKSVAGFPPGEYSVEVFLDGQSVGTRAFRVDAGR